MRECGGVGDSVRARWVPARGGGEPALAGFTVAGPQPPSAPVTMMDVDDPVKDLVKESDVVEAGDAKMEDQEAHGTGSCVAATRALAFKLERPVVIPKFHLSPQKENQIFA